MCVNEGHKNHANSVQLPRAFPRPKRVHQLQGMVELQKTQGRGLQDSTSSKPIAPTIASGPWQQYPSYQVMRLAPSISPASAPPSHDGTPAIRNWQHTAIDPSLEENILDPCLQTDSQEFNLDRGFMAEMLNLITDEERTPIPMEQAIPYGGGRIGENKESHNYEFLARGLPDEATYQDYLRSELEKLMNKFEIEYNVYLQRQNHPSTTRKLSDRFNQQPEITPMVEPEETGMLVVPTLEPGQSYRSTEGSESSRLLALELEAQVFTNHDLIPGRGFDWVKTPFLFPV